jgi:phosphatidylserine/phosphatidylglycerophosphate/cardiolipin synthase-like enzyme
MTAVPALELVVITKPDQRVDRPRLRVDVPHDAESSARASPRASTRSSSAAFDTELEVFGFDETESRFVDMDVHSKLLIVDDVFLSVGSCNKNNRGVVYEGELNVAGLVYSLEFNQLEDCLLESVGPDMTGASDAPADP